MALLPALFQNIDPMPMALGAKIVAPVPKKLDPIAAFEKGVHTPGGKVVGVDKGRGGSDFTAIDILRRKHMEWVKGDWGPVKGWADSEAVRNELHKSLFSIKPQVIIHEGKQARELFEEAKALVNTVCGIPAIPIGEAKVLRDRHAVASDIRAIRTLSDEVTTPRQNAIAAKMAEVQRQKQELRALTRKDTKR